MYDQVTTQLFYALKNDIRTAKTVYQYAQANAIDNFSAVIRVRPISSTKGNIQLVRDEEQNYILDLLRALRMSSVALQLRICDSSHIEQSE